MSREASVVASQWPTSSDPYALTRWAPVKVDDLVRVGRSQDGGYVIPRRCVDATSVLIGCGICDDWSFEEAFLEAKPDVTVLGIDGSVSPGVFRTRAREHIARAVFAAARGKLSRALSEGRTAKALRQTANRFRDFFDGRTRHFRQVFLSDLPGKWVATWDELWRDEKILASIPDGSHAVFVKMDIEGAEYRVLTDLAVHASKISGLTVEFHDCDIHWDCFNKIMAHLSGAFAVVHIHGNNYAPLIRGSNTPRALEISFIARAFLDDAAPRRTGQFPLAELDRPCDPARPDYPIHF